MKVKELIAALKLMDPELEVFSYCDHGQTPEKTQLPSLFWHGAESWDEYAMDEFEAKEYGYTTKAVIL